MHCLRLPENMNVNHKLNNVYKTIGTSEEYLKHINANIMETKKYNIELANFILNILIMYKICKTNL